MPKQNVEPLTGAVTEHAPVHLLADAEVEVLLARKEKARREHPESDEEGDES